MAHFRLTPDAQSDLIEIRRYTQQQWDNAQSKKYLSELWKTLHLFAETSSIGKSRPDIGIDILSFPHVSHVIYYVIHEQELLVFSVLHKCMVPLNHLMVRKIP